MVNMRRDLILGGLIGAAGSLALSEPFLFGLHNWLEWTWWVTVSAAYLAGAWLVRREHQNRQISN